MTKAMRSQWNERYRTGQGPQARRADARVARDALFVDALAAACAVQGRKPAALDVACGAGGTLVWLAARNWQVTGVDISDAALELARAALEGENLAQHATLKQVDLDHWRPPVAAFDLVTCFFFWDRELLPALGAAVRPGGLLIYETFNIHRLAERPDASPDFLLRPGELATTIAGWGWELAAQESDGDSVSRPTDSVVARKPA